MRIIEIELFRYKPFLVNEVETLYMEMPCDIQNIIGTNGCGKTSLLRELNPRPATRTDYGEDGFKKITILHGNNRFILTSDFSNSSSPHSFLKDDEELNLSGTTDVQNELVISHLGYTSQIHNIVYGVFPLSRMQVGVRKNYLLSTHPCQMKLILDKHKKVNSALRACRDNLSMLHERRATLASQLIDDFIKETLVQEQTELSHQLGTVVEATHRLNNQKTNIQKELNGMTLPETTEDLKKIISLKPNYVQYHLIPRDIPIEICKNTTANELSAISIKLENIQTRIRDLILEIDKYEQHVKQNDAKGAIDLIEASITTLTQDIKLLESQSIQNPFDHYVLEKIPEHINYLTDLISFFIGYSEPIPSMKDIYNLREKLTKLKEQKYFIEQEELSLLNQLEIHEKTLHETFIKNIPQSCCDCILFQNYKNNLNSAQAKYDIVDIKLKQVQLKKKRISFIFENRFTQLSLYEKAVPQLQKISDFFNENKYLLIPLKDIDLLQILRKNPSIILVKIQNHFNLSQMFYDLKSKKETLNKLILEHTKLKTPSEFGQQFLEQMLREKHQELEQIRNEYNIQDKLRINKNNFLKLLNNYEQDLTLVKRTLEASKTLEIFKVLEHEKEICDLYITHLNKIKLEIVSRLTEIDKTLREQDAIMARYRDEVMENIEKISIQEKEYTEIEKALSPTSGIPHKYMVQFLNDLFTDANIFISEVFSIPFEFILLDENKTLDYKFKMQVGEVIVPDISECSDAQMEMANFAFNLALSITREQSQYPLALDEVGRSFDQYHKQKLVEFLKTIVDDGFVSQLFLINHHAIISAGLLNSDCVVLNDSNIVVPEIYNEHVRIEKY